MAWSVLSLYREMGFLSLSLSVPSWNPSQSPPLTGLCSLPVPCSFPHPQRKTECCSLVLITIPPFTSIFNYIHLHARTASTALGQHLSSLSLPPVSACYRPAVKKTVFLHAREGVNLNDTVSLLQLYQGRCSDPKIYVLESVIFPPSRDSNLHNLPFPCSVKGQR